MNRDDMLKPCPFCGGEAERKTVKLYRKIKGRGQSWLAVVGCKSCSANTHQAGFSPEDAEKYAAQHWNNRTETARLTADLAAMTAVNLNLRDQLDYAGLVVDAYKTDRDAMTAERDMLRADLAAAEARCGRLGRLLDTRED